MFSEEPVTATPSWQLFDDLDVRAPEITIVRCAELEAARSDGRTRDRILSSGVKVSVGRSVGRLVAKIANLEFQRARIRRDAISSA